MASEKRLIDADMLIDKLYDNEFTTMCPLDEVCGVIDDCLAIDAVEVVRCKGCEYYHKYKCYAQNLINNKLYVPPLHMTGPDDFCSFGERRAGEWRENK